MCIRVRTSALCQYPISITAAPKNSYFLVTFDDERENIIAHATYDTASMLEFTSKNENVFLFLIPLFS